MRFSNPNQSSLSSTKSQITIFYFFLNRYSVSNDDDEDYNEKPAKVSPTKRMRKPPPPVKVNHDVH